MCIFVWKEVHIVAAFINATDTDLEYVIANVLLNINKDDDSIIAEFLVFFGLHEL